MLGYGFLAGLPLPLSGFTLRQWLTESGVSLALVGFTANISLPYTLKPLWAPLLDRPPPFSLSRFGRRRGWLLLIQPCLVIAGAALAFSHPADVPLRAVVLAGIVCFLSASQDIVVDAWRIESFEESRQGAALAAYIWGYRLALLTAGSGALFLASQVGWPTSLCAMAALLCCGPLLTLFAPEPTFAAMRLLAGRVSRELFIQPIRDLWMRSGSALIIAFVVLFKLGEAMAGVMTTPLYRHLGFTTAQVAATGLYSLAATIAGYGIGGLLVARMGTGRALIATGFAQTAALGMYLLLAQSPGSQMILAATVVTEAFTQGVADAAFLTYLSSLCSIAFTATQYAVLSSLAALGLHTLGGVSGLLAAGLGWVRFYTFTFAAALPAMVLMVVIVRRYPSSGERSAAPA
jgi:MFS transporter, PAT family, beta-lactamase induction signal transducer AmpG